MTIVEVGDDGTLHVPAQFLAGAQPRSQYELNMSGKVVTIRPIEGERPFWETATVEERIGAFKQWAESVPANTPNVPAEKLRREEWYD